MAIASKQDWSLNGVGEPEFRLSRQSDTRNPTRLPRADARLRKSATAALESKVKRQSMPCALGLRVARRLVRGDVAPDTRWRERRMGIAVDEASPQCKQPGPARAQLDELEQRFIQDRQLFMLPTMGLSLFGDVRSDDEQQRLARKESEDQVPRLLRA